MLLRSITKHVKDQNWFAVATDFFIVVVGVFLGIQVANWNAAQVEKKTTQVALERVKAELSNNQVAMQFWIDYLSRLQEHAIATQSWLERPIEEQNSQFLVDAFMTTSVSSVTLRREAYNDFLSLGPAKAHIDEEVLKNLANYFFFLDNQAYVLEKVPVFRNRLRGIIPFDVQLFIRRSCPIQIDILKQNFDFGEKCQPALTKEQMERTMVELSAVDFKHDLNLVLSDLILKIGLLRAFLQASDEMVELISRKQIKRSSA